MEKEKITIIGAGLVGSMLAVRLCQLGYEVEIFERRSDIRKEGLVGGRSINLALSNRGIRSLKMIGMNTVVDEHAIKMRGRMIHSLEGQLRLLSYSGREGDFINSIGRGHLNGLILDKLCTYPNATIHFNHKCTNVDLSNNIAFFKNEEDSLISQINFHKIIGTDGADSTLRKAIYQSLGPNNMDIHTEFLDHGYKELNIPPTEKGEFAMDPNALHIWPRGDFMMIALPNLDRSFTVTLFLSNDQGAENFAKLNTQQSVVEFFKKYFSDAIDLMPTFDRQFFNNPIGLLGTTKCSKWSYEDKALLMGDAAHPIVPFYGQGMNCGFEDCYYFSELLADQGGFSKDIFQLFENFRKPHSDAIADLAVDNFYEMRDRVNDIAFVKKAALEFKLEQNFPDYFSKYSMVTFREDMSYEEAMLRGRAQDNWLIDFCKKIDSIDSIDLVELKNNMTQKVTNF